MNQIIHDGIIYADNDIISGTVFSELSPISESLGYGTLEAEVKSASTNILQYKKNSPLVYRHNSIDIGTYYVQKIKRIGTMKYRISAIDAIGLLANRKHYGGIYTGQSAKEVIDDICGDVRVIVKSNIINTLIYGWLPIASRRDNLQQVLFAIGCVAKIDQNGVIRIEGLWGNISHTVNKISLDSDGDYPAPVTTVRLTEHQFIDSQTSALETLFEGAAAANDIITFDEPVHSLSATGFTIVESGANYVKVSGGNGKIEGKHYIHTTKERIQQITTAQDDNEAYYEEMTLVSIVNSQTVLERLSEYFAHQNTITGDTRQNMQRCGDVANVMHPYEKVLTPACILSNEITMSRSLKASQSYLVGYIPSDPNNVTYESKKELIVANGSFTVPDGVDSLRVVLIGGGNGGERGTNGYAGTAGGSNGPGRSGSSGTGGAGGLGGKVLELQLDNLTPGTVFPITIGAGGPPGIAGGATTFGSLSSDAGEVSSYGYVDVTTGETYGVTGVKGSAPDPIETQTSMYGAFCYFTLGEASGLTVLKQCGSKSSTSEVGFASTRLDTVLTGDKTYTSYQQLRVTCTTAQSGISPIPGTDAVKYGSGGNGGHGGGGGQGGYGYTVDTIPSFNQNGATWNIVYQNNSLGIGPPGSGGYGSSGGAGMSGCVLVFYDQPKVHQSGNIVDKNGKGVTDKLGRYVVV